MMISTKAATVSEQRLTTEAAIRYTKDSFEAHLQEHLPLIKISAPLVVLKGTGINDDLNGVERPVAFPIKYMQEKQAEVVQSLAKWKRLRLRDYELTAGTGILTDMRALRPDEEFGPLHSLYVDQWDWELVMQSQDRHLEFLKEQVEQIYAAILDTEQAVHKKYPGLAPRLPERIRFVHTETLLEKYPDLSPKEREHTVAREFGAVFLVGIGNVLRNGIPHDHRAPDYDDWSTPTSGHTTGLNGDLLLWSPELERSVEISSMGIRVNAEVLKSQLAIKKAEIRSRLYYHRQLLQGELPQTIGGGIGQSRLCMFLLRKRHIGEVQAGIWPGNLREECSRQGIFLL